MTIELEIVDDGNSDDVTEQVAEATTEVAEEVAEATTEVAETVADAIVEVVEAVTENQPAADTATVADVAFVAGATMAENEQLRARVAELEAERAAAEALAAAAIVEAAEPEGPPPVDEPPATRRTKFNQWWFGKK